MQAVSIILVLISLGTTVVPVGAAVYICRDNLPSLIIPPEVQGLINGNGSFFSADNSSDISPTNFIMPTFVSSTVDEPTKTFTITVNVTNFLNYGLTLNAINATALDQNGTELASIHLSSPVTLQAGQWQLVTVSGQWTQAAEDYFNNPTNATTVNVTLSNIVIDVNSIEIQSNQPVQIGSNQIGKGLLDNSLGDPNSYSGGKGQNPIADGED